MLSQRHRPLLYGLGALVLVWLIAWGSYLFFSKSKTTPEKVAAYLRSLDLASLSGDERAKALRDLARKMNALTPDQRQQARLQGEWRKWFAAMTDQEKGDFIEATMPSGVKQMLVTFEQLPADKREQAVRDALRNLQRAQRELEQDGTPAGEWGSEGERPQDLSPEVQQRMVQVGLNSFYSESSAQTKAELAPVLEEMQHLMERGALLRPRRPMQ